jgi:hypothetical protein
VSDIAQRKKEKKKTGSKTRRKCFFVVVVAVLNSSLHITRQPIYIHTNTLNENDRALCYM